jgi:deoxyribonuclease-4
MITDSGFTRDETDSKLLLLGAHFSIAKGFDQAIYEAQRYGCTALQVFTKNASTWKERRLSPVEIDLFKAAKLASGISHIAAHTSYLINIASPEKKKYIKSTTALEQELLRASALGIAHVVLHPGAHMNSGRSEGIIRIVKAINSLYDQLPEVETRLLLETTAGQGSSLGYAFEQLAEIIEKVHRKGRIGVCLDTSHIFAAGYDIRDKRSYRETITEFDQTIGLQKLALLHLNDSKKELGSRVDRHEHIGRGLIGPDAFKSIMNDERLQHIPKIIETPKKAEGIDWDRKNLDLLRSFCQTRYCKKG